MGLFVLHQLLLRIFFSVLTSIGELKIRLFLYCFIEFAVCKVYSLNMTNIDACYIRVLCDRKPMQILFKIFNRFARIKWSVCTTVELISP